MAQNVRMEDPKEELKLIYEECYLKKQLQCI